ncbi:MAG: pyridoxal-phosphate dependent enzyme, partial [Bacteroidales bacterium]|nr:pyridoxal-phosphate dependent enzyme [Bacteroidales bacterium]
MDNTQYFPQLHKISQAKITLGEIRSPTPLASNPYLSGKFGSDVMLKREVLQIVRSYKIRGAYNKIRNLSEQQRQAGVVCASAGNHAQGVAFSCNKLGIQGYIYMPKTTPKQKIEQVRMFGNSNIEIVL